MADAIKSGEVLIGVAVGTEDPTNVQHAKSLPASDVRELLELGSAALNDEGDFDAAGAAAGVANGLGTAAAKDIEDFDAAGAAAGVANGLGTAAAKDIEDFDAAGAAAGAVSGIPADPVAGTAGLRTLGTGPQQAAPGNDARFSAAPALPRAYIDGLMLSWSSTTVFGIAAGVARNSLNGANLALAAAWTKTTAAWAAGSGNGSMDTGAFARNAWHYVFLIAKADGTTDILLSLSATAPALPATYVIFRRIGALRGNNSTQLAKFWQVGSLFYLDVPVNDVNVSNLSTSRVLYTVTVPPLMRWLGAWNGGQPGDNAGQVLITSGGQADTPPTTTVFSLGLLQSYSPNSSTQQPVFVNASSQIGARASAASTSFVVTTFGWEDLRGQDGST